MPASVDTDDTYIALVGELSRIGLPTVIMAVTQMGVGVFAARALDSGILAAAVVTGGLSSACKLVIVLRHLRRLARGPLTRAQARRWEWGQILTTTGVASSIGTTVATIFAHPSIELQMLATGMLFGYCSGVVTNLAVRPVIATGALLLAALPAIVAAAWSGGVTHGILATMFGLFLVGALQSVLYSYRTAVRQIGLRLDMSALARSDALTGLANRFGLRRAFLGLPGIGNDSVAVHCFDLDGFKPVNDRYGHAAGDALLQELGARLRRLVAAPALAARIGGDEFVVLQPGVRHRREAETLARRIVHVLGAPYELAGETVGVGLSLGFACAPSCTADLDDLMRKADAASYAVKRRGGGGVAASEDGLPAEPHRVGAVSCSEPEPAMP